MQSSLSDPNDIVKDFLNILRTVKCMYIYIIDQSKFNRRDSKY